MIVSCIWAITSFSYYLIIFKLKSLPGDIFVNSAFASVANALGHFMSLWIYKVLSVRKSIMTFFIIQFLGSIPLCL